MAREEHIRWTLSSNYGTDFTCNAVQLTIPVKEKRDSMHAKADSYDNIIYMHANSKLKKSINTKTEHTI
jgi:hypothetical protein